jgi:2Fe-2S ferredoxin
MPGQNPYIQESNVRLPTRRYKLTIIDEQQKEHVIEVDPARIPYEDHGLPGSILDIAMGCGIEIDHACGGVCACSTCHVIVREGGETCNDATDDEEDQLEEAYGLTSKSRLACQCVPDGTKDVVVVVPSWNRNLAREGPAPH